MSLIIDYRENDLLSNLPSGTPTKNLPVGDAWIGIQEDGSIAQHGVIVDVKRSPIWKQVYSMDVTVNSARVY
jgi:hypothetical protein